MALKISPSFWTSSPAIHTYLPVCASPEPRRIWPGIVPSWVDPQHTTLQQLCVGQRGFGLQGRTQSSPGNTQLDKPSHVSSLLCRCPVNRASGDLTCYTIAPELQQLQRLCSMRCSCPDWRQIEDLTDSDEYDSDASAESIGPKYPEPDEERGSLASEGSSDNFQCGSSRSCAGASDCNSDWTRRGCEDIVCVVQKKLTDAFFQLGMCIPLLTIHSRLPREGRDLMLSSCACNRTYVSNACCGSVDGAVWENNGSKLGALEL